MAVGDRSHPAYEEWVIRVCNCGFPLGATLAAIRLGACPDCGQVVIPIDDRTRHVHVLNAELLRQSSRWEKDNPEEEGMELEPASSPIWLPVVLLLVLGAALADAIWVAVR